MKIIIAYFARTSRDSIYRRKEDRRSQTYYCVVLCVSHSWNLEIWNLCRRRGFCGVWSLVRIACVDTVTRGHRWNMEVRWRASGTTYWPPTRRGNPGDTLVPNFSQSSLPLEIAEIEKLDPNMTWRAYISDRYFLHVVLSGIVTPKFEIRQWLQHLSDKIHKKLVANNPVNAIPYGHNTFIINFENRIPYVLQQKPVVGTNQQHN